ncbi:inwardly-rectifying channel [Sphingopyxis sp. EG6]|nr:inwardly-rectifying channel [Sphingopyxis sp. EG6]
MIITWTVTNGLCWRIDLANTSRAEWGIDDGSGSYRPIAAVDPPCRAAMGRWQREALTEGLWRYRRRPSTIRFANGPPPHGFATGRIYSIVIPACAGMTN